MLQPPLDTNTKSASTAGRSRLTDLDALRGFALLGIAVVNATYFASAFHGTGVADPGVTTTSDRAVSTLITLLFETKFYLLFSFLFGYSFTLQRLSAQRRGTRFTAPFLRRLAALFALGAAHAVLLFTGDILTTYAVLGLVLLAAGGLRVRTVATAACVLLVLTAAFYAGLGALQAAFGPPSTLDAQAVTAHAQHATALLAGDPAQVITARLEELPDTAALLLLFQAPCALAMFLLGLAAGKRDLLARPISASALRRVQLIGFPVGLAGAGLYTHATTHGTGTPGETFALAVDVLTAPALAAAYAATLLRLIHSRYGRRIAGALAPAGRMALSNYLTQSAVLAVVFTGYGFAAIGRLAPATVLALVLALYALQLSASARWMRTHAYGPLEWLLRAATHLTLPPWRAAAERTPV
ncbi:DUF418 domain-containing protein [Streptomyces luteolifulvus]|uniref:DUF418 domain-containing protein n=1 Tax=Streptomyces luteolifulvus TaxID=2615112 RepID=UPI001CD9DFE5|nr:DUF418 domain-containing protein [Streptomyces luteolifulvus]